MGVCERQREREEHRGDPPGPANDGPQRVRREPTTKARKKKAR